MDELTALFPVAPIGQPTIGIAFQYTRKDPVLSPDMYDLVLHYDSGLFKNIEPHLEVIGTHAVVGDWNDSTVAIYYMLPPSLDNPKTIFLTVEFDTQTQTFVERIYLPNGAVVEEAGNFRIVENAHPDPSTAIWSAIRESVPGYFGATNSPEATVSQ